MGHVPKCRGTRQAAKRRLYTHMSIGSRQHSNVIYRWSRAGPVNWSTCRRLPLPLAPAVHWVGLSETREHDDDNVSTRNTRVLCVCKNTPHRSTSTSARNRSMKILSGPTSFGLCSCSSLLLSARVCNQWRTSALNHPILSYLQNVVSVFKTWITLTEPQQIWIKIFFCHFNFLL